MPTTLSVLTSPSFAIVLLRSVSGRSRIVKFFLGFAHLTMLLPFRQREKLSPGLIVMPPPGAPVPVTPCSMAAAGYSPAA